MGELKSLYRIEPSSKQHIDTQMGLILHFFLRSLWDGRYSSLKNLIEFYDFLELMLVLHSF